MERLLEARLRLDAELDELCAFCRSGGFSYDEAKRRMANLILAIESYERLIETCGREAIGQPDGSTLPAQP